VLPLLNTRARRAPYEPLGAVHAAETAAISAPPLGRFGKRQRRANKQAKTGLACCAGIGAAPPNGGAPPRATHCVALTHWRGRPRQWVNT